jgi:dolichyl-phosphate-mannose--protein O-mannosyl transferase
MISTPSLKKTLLLPLLILSVSYCTIFRGYEEPRALFWDENYHIAAAQKYLNGVFFMEPHPPLGKLLIAAGEYLLNANETDDQFIQTDHAESTPSNFSFAGYRLIPTLLATLCPLLLYLTLSPFCSTRVSALAALFFALDNALVVHLRAAMLEGTQLFFILCFLLTLSRLIRSLLKSNDILGRPKLIAIGAVCGFSLACVLTTKLNGIILFVLLAPCLWFLFKKDKLIDFASSSFLSFAIFYIAIWQIHFSLGRKIEPKLSNRGFYQASLPYRLSLERDGGNSISFLSKIQDHYGYLAHYTNGVPNINFCKREENGSPWYWWLVGGKSISYRWDKKDGITHFLYLIANPVGWALSLFGVLIAATASFSWLFYRTLIPNRNHYFLATLLSSWAVYLAIFGSLGRVMYLYHYFIPLLLGWMMLALSVKDIVRFGPLVLSGSIKSVLIFLAIVTEVSCFYFFSPLTYAKGLTEDQLKKRAWLDVWDLKCPGCESRNPIARPIGDPKKSVTLDISVSGLRATETYQEWGEPVMNRTVTREVVRVQQKDYQSALGVHAKSSIVFLTKRRFGMFAAKVALPDYLLEKSGGSVIFSVIGDGQTLWKSNVLKAGEEPQSLEVDISNIQTLTLEVTDAGDGNTDDHAVWIEPALR